MLKKIFHIERIKTQHYPAFRTIIILHALLFLLVALVASNFRINIQGLTIERLFHFPNIWNTLAWFASWFNLLLGILAIMLITNEFQFRTFRKQLIDGLSRNELLGGKVMVLAFLAAYTMLLVFLVGIIMGIIKSPNFVLNDFFQGLKFLPILYIQALGYMLLAMLFAFIFRNTALSIISFFLYFFPIEPIIRAFIPDTAVGFLPVKIISKLTPMPDFVGISLGDVVHLPSGGTSEFYNLGVYSKSLPLHITSLIVLAYCILFVLISKFVVNRKNF